MEEIHKCGFMEFDISNDKGEISIERMLDVMPSLGVSSIITEGTNDVARFLLKRKLADVFIHVVMPSFKGRDLDFLDENTELADPRTVELGGATVYFSSF